MQEFRYSALRIDDFKVNGIETMDKKQTPKRHKWVETKGGKQCSVCGSSINTKKHGFFRYIEFDKWGIADAVNWYPRCQYIQTSVSDGTAQVINSLRLKYRQQPTHNSKNKRNG